MNLAKGKKERERKKGNTSQFNANNYIQVNE